MKKNKVEKKVINIISRYTDVKKARIKSQSLLKEELDLSSFDLVSITVEFEKAFSITFKDVTCFEQLMTLGDITQFICNTIDSNKK